MSDEVRGDGAASEELQASRWMMNETNPLIWPSPNGIGAMPLDSWNQTVAVSVEAGIIPGEPDQGAYRTDLADQAPQGITGDVTGSNFQKGSV